MCEVHLHRRMKQPAIPAMHLKIFKSLFSDLFSPQFTRVHNCVFFLHQVQIGYRLLDHLLLESALFTLEKTKLSELKKFRINQLSANSKEKKKA